MNVISERFGSLAVSIAILRLDLVPRIRLHAKSGIPPMTPRDPHGDFRIALQLQALGQRNRQRKGKSNVKYLVRTDLFEQ